jgi:polysaccharide biosynthesis/export protein
MINLAKAFIAAILVAVFALHGPVHAQKAAQAADDKGYILGSGDVIEVDVLGQSDFKTRARIRSDGTIALPFLGVVSVAGQTSIDFAKKIASSLAAGGYYTNPVVNVEVAGYASRYVIVLGEVASPGLQPIDRAYRVSEIIARSGGIRPSGADYVIVRREKGEELRLDFQKLATGTEADDPFVNAGDKIYVPQADLFYMYGQINAPGAFGLMSGMTLRKAIARGGGMTQLGSEKKISVFRAGRKQPLGLDQPIQAGDVIVVGERSF